MPFLQVGNRIPSFEIKKLGFCIPKSCNFKDLELMLNQIGSEQLKGTGLKAELVVRPTMCQTSEMESIPNSVILVG